MTGTPRLAFIDFFKCVGITVIIYGHVAGWAPLADFPPIHLKQIGVALFLFATGYSLASERRATGVVLFNRLFEPFVFGLGLALLLSAAGAVVDGGWRASNYLPFVGGVNVLVNNFPANPTTWYIGTYIHVLLLWSFALRRIQLSLAVVAAAFVLEVVLRALLLDRAGAFVAYMTVPNWLTVFLLGHYCGRRGIDRLPGPPWMWGAGLAIFGAFWLSATARLPLENAFPFYTTPGSDSISRIGLSLAISAVYVITVVLSLGIFGRLNAGRAVTYIARNTLVVFLAHMPVYYALLRWLPDGLTPATRSGLMMIICLPGLAFVSDVLRRGRWLSALRRRMSLVLIGVESRTPGTVAQIV